MTQILLFTRVMYFGLEFCSYPFLFPNKETVRRDRVTHCTIIKGFIIKYHIISKYDLSKEQSKALSKMLNCTKISATADVGVDVVVVFVVVDIF